MKQNKICKPALGVVTTWFRGQYQQELISGIEWEARNKNLGVVYFAGRCLHSPDPPDNAHNAIFNLIPQESLQGLIVTGLLANHCSQQQMQAFLSRFDRIPIVTLDYKVPGVPGVLLDNGEGFRKLMTHLLVEHGYRKFAFLGGDAGNLGSSQRYEIFLRMLEEYGIRAEQQLILQGDFSYLSGRKAARELLDGKKIRLRGNVEVIVAANDLMAFGVKEELKRSGIRVPEDVAITGFDDSTDAAVTLPALTTVSQPVFAMGRQAVRCLLGQGKNTGDCYFKTKLVIRQSCGCFGHAVSAEDNLPDIREEYVHQPVSEFSLYQLIYVSDALKQVMTIEELSDWMKHGLYSLGIPHYALFLYNQQDRNCCALAAVDGKSTSDFDLSCMSCNAAVQWILQSDNLNSCCLLPLLFREEIFGFLCLEVNPESWLAYETLRSQISASLKNIFLIQESKQINRQLRDANERLRLADEQKTGLFINIAHETKTPLTLIMNYLGKYMQEHPPDSGLEIIRDNLNILKENMLNFLDMEKLQQGKVLYEHGRIIDAGLQLSGKAALFSETAGLKNLRLHYTPVTGVYIHIDPWALDRVLNNLLDNAVKFTPPGGRIELSLTGDREHVELAVTDSGCGIKEEDIHNIFKPYYQLSTELSSNQGIGMGLYVVKKILDELGAAIQVKSTLGKGTEFRLTFKAAYEAPAQAETYFHPALFKNPQVHAVVKEEPVSPNKKSLLIVDDNRSMLIFLQSALKASYNVFMATGVREAMFRLAAIPVPDIIISDIMMPGLDGHQFMSALGNNTELASIPFIFLTAKQSEEEKLQGLAGGAIDFIKKPFSIEELKLKIDALIGLRARQQERDALELQQKINALFSSDSRKNGQAAADVERICLKYKISHREKEVLILMLKGLLNKEIAGAMQLSLRTVEFHISHIYKKLNLHDRHEFLAFFQRT